MKRQHLVPKKKFHYILNKIIDIWFLLVWCRSKLPSCETPASTNFYTSAVAVLIPSWPIYQRIIYLNIFHPKSCDISNRLKNQFEFQKAYISQPAPAPTFYLQVANLHGHYLLLSKQYLRVYTHFFMPEINNEGWYSRIRVINLLV